MANYYFDTAQGQIYAQVWTPAEILAASPLILLHESLGCVGLWKDFPAALARRLQRQVIAYDRLGYGQSAAQQALPPLSFIEDEARQFVEHLKQPLQKLLGFKKYTLFGHSVGGAMAICIAAQDPECQAVISEAAQAFVEPLTLQGIRNAQGLFAEAKQFERLAKWHAEKTEWVLRAWTDVWLDPEFADWNLAEALKQLYCPLLAIHGERDEYGSLAFPEFIIKHVKGPAEQWILPGCGHSPHRECPDELIQRVQAFLGRLSLRA